MSAIQSYGCPPCKALELFARRSRRTQSSAFHRNTRLDLPLSSSFRDGLIVWLKVKTCFLGNRRRPRCGTRTAAWRLKPYVRYFLSSFSLSFKSVPFESVPRFGGRFSLSSKSVPFKSVPKFLSGRSKSCAAIKGRITYCSDRGYGYGG